jgi:hypothetical protein
MEFESLCRSLVTIAIEMVMSGNRELLYDCLTYLVHRRRCRDHHKIVAADFHGVVNYSMGKTEMKGTRGKMGRLLRCFPRLKLKVAERNSLP